MFPVSVVSRTFPDASALLLFMPAIFRLLSLLPMYTLEPFAWTVPFAFTKIEFVCEPTSPAASNETFPFD